GRDLVLVPAAQRRRITEGKPLEPRRRTGGEAGLKRRPDGAAASRIEVAGLHGVALVAEVAAERRRPGVKLVICLHALARLGTEVKCLIVGNTGDRRIGVLS